MIHGKESDVTRSKLLSINQVRCIAVREAFVVRSVKCEVTRYIAKLPCRYCKLWILILLVKNTLSIFARPYHIQWEVQPFDLPRVLSTERDPTSYRVTFFPMPTSMVKDFHFSCQNDINQNCAGSCGDVGSLQGSRLFCGGERKEEEKETFCPLVFAASTPLDQGVFGMPRLDKFLTIEPSTLDPFIFCGFRRYISEMSSLKEFPIVRRIIPSQLTTLSSKHLGLC